MYELPETGRTMAVDEPIEDTAVRTDLPALRGTESPKRQRR